MGTLRVEPALKSPKTLDNDRVISIHRDLNTGNDCVRVVRVVEDRINGRKVGSCRDQMQWLSLVNRFGDFSQNRRFPKVDTSNGPTIGPCRMVGVGQPTYRKPVCINAIEVVECQSFEQKTPERLCTRNHRNLAVEVNDRISFTSPVLFQQEIQSPFRDSFELASREQPLFIGWENLKNPMGDVVATHLSPDKQLHQTVVAGRMPHGFLTASTTEFILSFNLSTDEEASKHRRGLQPKYVVDSLSN